MTKYKICNEKECKIVKGIEIIQLSKNIIDEKTRKDFLYKYKFRKSYILNVDDAIQYLKSQGYYVEREFM